MVLEKGHLCSKVTELALESKHDSQGGWADYLLGLEEKFDRYHSGNYYGN